jgi:hypothetical protein
MSTAVPAPAPAHDPKAVFIKDYNDPLQPLSIELENDGYYTTAANEIIKITNISPESSMITYVKLGKVDATKFDVTGNEFFKLLESGINHDRTFKASRNGIIGGNIYTMTSDTILGR